MEAQTLENVFQPEDAFINGRWRTDFFQNNNPITLELGCGTGMFSLALAQQDPNKNVIGVDIKGARIWAGAKIALQARVSSVAFLRTPIEEIANFFAPGEVNEMWIMFPDPFPRPGRAHRRLTAPRFLSLYKHILAPGGLVHLKTDDLALFAFTRDTVRGAEYILHMTKENIYTEPITDPVLALQTAYEKRHIAQGKKIHYLSFSF